MADLDERLRRAFAAAPRPESVDQARAELIAALPRHRAARRHAITAGATALAVIVVVVVVVLTGVAPRPAVTAGPATPSPRVPANATCVEVQVGSKNPSCVGGLGATTSNHSATAGPFGQNGQVAAPTEAGPELGPLDVAPSGTLRVAVGTRVFVSLPKLTGASWRRVVLVGPAPGSGSSGSPDTGVAERVLVIHVGRTDGRSVAVVSSDASGIFEIVATATCTIAGSCSPGARQWAIALHVAKVRGGKR